MTSLLPPEDGPLVPDARKRWLVIFAVWTGIALFFCLQDAVRFAMRNQPLEWWVIRSEVAYWWLWIPLTPLALAAVRRFWITRENRWRTIAVHCAIGLFIGFLHEGGLMLLLYVTRDNPMLVPVTANMQPIDLARMPVGILTGFYKYWALIGVYSAFVYARRTRVQQVHSAQLETRLAQAELQALRMQLHPHFLFNTLHAVSMLNFSDVDAANRMLVRLSDLLRMSLVNAGRQHVRLSDEMDFLRKYLEIEQTRFHDRLRVDIDVDEQLLDAEVPNLVLQPLVENAIRHGVSRSSQPGVIEISVRRNGDDLVLKVCDNGPGMPAPFNADEHAGIGLSTTITRLQQLYGDRHSFRIGPRNEGGTCAQIVLPYMLTEAQ